MPRQVAERLEPSDDSSGPSLIDYSEKRSLPISIPDYNTEDKHGDKYVVSYRHAKPLDNSDIASVHFNHFYCMGICDKLSRHLYMLTYIYLNVDES